MTKNELISHIADEADISRAAAGRALNATLDAVGQSLRAGEPVALMGFGTFLVRERSERSGRNPRTGDSMTIAAAKVPAFKPAKSLRDSLN